MELLTQILIGLGSACAIYGGIRADLKHHAESIKAANGEAQRAHARIDNHIENHGRA